MSFPNQKPHREDLDRSEDARNQAEKNKPY